MTAFGAKAAPVDHTPWRVEPTKYTATDFAIEPDASAATYLWAAEALTGGNIDLGVPMEAFTQPDAQAAKFIRMFPQLPAEIDGIALPIIVLTSDGSRRTPDRCDAAPGARVPSGSSTWDFQSKRSPRWVADAARSGTAAVRAAPCPAAWASCGPGAHGRRGS